MKRLLIGLLFASAALAQSPVTVTGLITDAGNNVATSGYVEFDIIPTSISLHYFISGFGTITQKVQCGINGSGLVKSKANLANPCTVWGNDLINPANTQYKIIFAPNGIITNQVSGECITGTTYSLNSPVFCPVVQISPQQTIVRANPFQTNIIPVADNVFNIGSPAFRYASVVAGNLTSTSLTVGNCVQAGSNGLLTTVSASCANAAAITSRSANTFFAAPNGAPGIPTFRAIVTADLPVGTGTVTSFSSGNLSPLFNTSVATSTTTPAQTFSLLTAAANTVFGNCTGSTAAPSHCTITPAMLPGGGSVSSVGLALPPQYSVSGTPVTSTGTFNGTWVPVPPNYVLAGPAVNSIGGIYDGMSGVIGTSAAPSTSLTPSTAHDWAFVVVQASGQSSAPTMPGGWTRNFTNGNAGATFHQVFSSNATITAPVTLSASGNWADVLFLLRLPGGSPTIVQSQNTTGAFTSTTNTFSGNTVAGNSILAIFCGVPATGTTTAKFTDVQGNVYTQLGYAQNGTAEVCIAGLTSSITGATTDPVTVTTNGSNTGAFFLTMEVSNIATGTSEPTFRALLPGDFATSPTVQVFSSTTLGSDLAVSATTQTDVMTRTVVMPSNGCPCRAFLSYSLYVTTASSGVGYSAWVNDGTANMAGSNAGQSNGSSGALTSLSFGGYSTVTYANNASVTFTLRTEGDHTYTIRKASQVAGSAPDSSFQVSVSLSN